MTAPEDRIEAARDAARPWLDEIPRGGTELDRLTVAEQLANRAYLIPEERVALIAKAGQSRAAWDACAILFERLQRRGDSVPDDLAGFITQALLTGQRPSIRGAPTKGQRDALIVFAVLAAHRAGLPLYNTEGAESACSVVADLACLGTDAVKKIWQNSGYTMPDEGYAPIRG